MKKITTTIALLLVLSCSISIFFTPAVSATEDSWATMEPMPTARSGLGVAVVDGKIYAIGGYNDDPDQVAVNEMYTPLGYIPEFPSWVILPLFFVATLVGVAVKRKVFRPT
jgi:hypothetical protein